MRRKHPTRTYTEGTEGLNFENINQLTDLKTG